MNLPYALNTYCGSALLIILIFADCCVKFSTDIKIKKYFCALLIITFLSIVTDMFFSLFDILPPDLTIINIGRAVFFFTPLVFALCVVFLIRKANRHNGLLIVFFLTLFTISTGFNVVVGSIKLFWSVIAALMIYIYLFKILNEAKYDNLTGLNNRYSFFEFAGRISRNNNGDSWIILMIDINNFKSINSIYGQLEGDSVLCTLARILNKCANKSDFTARYGGDEFILVTHLDKNMDEFINIIYKELDIYNQNSDKLYNIEINYRYDTYIADGKTHIDVFLNQIDRYLKKKFGDRRMGDVKI
ncbi:MAG: GGDEF domain-containing protein [Treponema sp.]|nr:GGDEF domain-containing protein [Treponema sp.]